MTSRPSDNFFATTRWTMVMTAGQSGGAALGELCESYWFPVYAYVRRRGHMKEDAEDLTQGFFASLLARGDIAGLRRENGKFRAFLLAAMKHYLANDHDKHQRLKRGGGAPHLSLDWQQADLRFRVADENSLPPDAAYDREWATALLERVLETMAAESDERFVHLKSYLSLEREQIPYSTAAAALGLEEGAVRVAVHRLRKRYRQLLRQEIARTLAEPELVDEELRSLMEAFG
ncbi:RNA polymerase sigma factor [Luteolibacter soli]|uniref:Sigma-70 family RNA polymerase sigma factor n=1 Tax=Luteolibacter soli TaxID=3135280 RepID=A0ABU9AUL6_9BACT